VHVTACVCAPSPVDFFSRAKGRAKGSPAMRHSEVPDMMPLFKEALRCIRLRAALSELPLCEQIERVKCAIRSGRATFRDAVLPEHRTHLAECCQCCDQHQAVVDVFRAYDREQLSELGQLIGQLRSAIDYRNRLHLLTESSEETRALLEGATVDGDSRAADGSLSEASPEEAAQNREPPSARLWMSPILSTRPRCCAWCFRKQHGTRGCLLPAQRAARNSCGQYSSCRMPWSRITPFKFPS